MNTEFQQKLNEAREIGGYETFTDMDGSHCWDRYCAQSYKDEICEILNFVPDFSLGATGKQILDKIRELKLKADNWDEFIGNLKKL